MVMAGFFYVIIQRSIQLGGFKKDRETADDGGRGPPSPSQKKEGEKKEESVREGHITLGSISLSHCDHRKRRNRALNPKSIAT